MILESSRTSQQVFVDLDAVSVFADRLAAEVTRCLPECQGLSIGVLMRDTKVAQEFLNDMITAVESRIAGDEKASGMAVDSSAKRSPADTPTALPALPPVTHGGPAMCSSDTKSILKSLFKFLLFVVQVPAFATTVRSVVEGELLSTIETIMRCPAYFGNTSWAYAAKWITDFSNNEPNLIAVVQDAGVHTAILDVLETDVPPSSDIIQVHTLFCLIGVMLGSRSYR
jgi:hypothetical protein